MTQPDLFEIVKPLPPWCRSSPETSREAAVAAAPKSARQREVVYDALAGRRDGATLEELQEITGLPGDAVRPRLWELRGENRKRPLPVRVVDSGQRRRTTSGRRAVVWLAT